MNKYATRETQERVLVWIIWFIVLLTASTVQVVDQGTTTPLLGIVTHDESRSGALFPWQSHKRWKKWALHRYKKWRKSYRRAKRRVRLARLAMAGMVTMAEVVDFLTEKQLRYKIGALPVLYALLQTLEVEKIINRHSSTKGEVEHGTVAVVMILNRLMLPLPLYRIADWVGQTSLVATLGIPAEKFNDDRLGRTLDALYPHLDVIWQEIIEVALVRAGIDLSVIFYDVTAFIAHGRYADSELMEFGFAHNTPSNKRKFKMALNATADGNIPWNYRLLPGSTADVATVEENLENLASWLHSHDYMCRDSLIVGDRAMLNAEIAVLYDVHGLRHLTGLRASTLEQKKIVECWTDEQFEAQPIVDGPSPQYWGRESQITFTHEGESVTHKALVVVAGPLRDQLRSARQGALDTLFEKLEELRGRIGQPRLRTVKIVERSVNARLKASKVSQFVNVSVYETPTGQVNLIWRLNDTTLAAARRKDGRYP